MRLDHLGPHATVALYVNDRQIQEAHYRQVVSARPSYSVRVFKLESEPRS